MMVRRLKILAQRFVDLRPGEAGRVLLMAAFLFFLLAANNVIKVIRDSLFLSRFPISQLPYVYLLAALVAAAVILLYSRFTSKLPFSRLVLASLVVSIVNIMLFWLLVTFAEAGWVLYAFYMWSAIVGLTLIAQFWTLANQMFTLRDGKRLFGLITAGGTLGGMAGGLMAHWAVTYFFGLNQLFWLVAALLAGAYAVALLALKQQAVSSGPADRRGSFTSAAPAQDMSGILGTMLGSRYLQTIGAVIFVSVVVSTLIDFQFKATAKVAYPSADALAGFFGSYYAWLSGVTMLAQVWLTGKVLLGWGLTPSLLFLPTALLAGSISFLAWPGLVAATANRMAEASLRTSVNQSGVQVLYLPVPDAIKKKVKVFMDVTVERLGDGAAALIILFFTFVLGWGEVRLLSYVALPLILLWIAIVLSTQQGYLGTLRESLAFREGVLEFAPIDFSDKGTVEAVLSNLEGKDEPSILFALTLAERMDPRFVVARLPRGLLSHRSAEVRRRALTLVASSLEPNTLTMVFELLAAKSVEMRGEAITTVAALLKEAAIPVIRPLLKSPEIQARRAAIQLMLQNGDADNRQEALTVFHELVTAGDPDGEPSRVQAARLLGEIDHPELSAYLSKLIRDDPSPMVIREAMTAAARRKNSAAMVEIIARLGSSVTNAAARDALVSYGEIAVRALRAALFDNIVPADIRRQIPRTLSKIHAQPAINALQAGLIEEDRAIRFQVILALEEMVRRFPDLRLDREIVESALMSDALLYFRRLVLFWALFGEREIAAAPQQSLLYHALNDSMARVTQRIMWLLSLIYPRDDIHHAWAGLGSKDPVPRAHGIELLDNLLTGNVRNYVFPIFSDGQPGQRVSAALNFLGLKAIDDDEAIRSLLAQDDRWLKAAVVWEIGQRRLRGFRSDLLNLADSSDALLRETANLVLERGKIA